MKQKIEVARMPVRSNAGNSEPSPVFTGKINSKMPSRTEAQPEIKHDEQGVIIPDQTEVK
jgi:hypothetical protein